MNRSARVNTRPPLTVSDPLLVGSGVRHSTFTPRFRSHASTGRASGKRPEWSLRHPTVPCSGGSSLAYASSRRADASFASAAVRGCPLTQMRNAKKCGYCLLSQRTMSRLRPLPSGTWKRNVLTSLARPTSPLTQTRRSLTHTHPPSLIWTAAHSRQSRGQRSSLTA